MRNIKPPLPFTGHKGQWGKELEEIAHRLPAGCAVFDVFGGSGICAEYFMRARPGLRVVWNDFDNYRARLDNAGKAEALRRYFLEHLPPRPPKGSFIPPLTPGERQFVFDTIRQQLADFGFCDLQTLSRWFYLYPMKTQKLMSFTGKLYNRVPLAPINLGACAGWLSGACRNSVTFSGLDTPFHIFGVEAPPRSFAGSQDALFIFDPPYLATGRDDYGNKEALKVLSGICECASCLPFLLFGDSSISFWYEAILKGRRFMKYEKAVNNCGPNHTTRREVMFACLPGDG